MNLRPDFHPPGHGKDPTCEVTGGLPFALRHDSMIA